MCPRNNNLPYAFEKKRDELLKKSSEKEDYKQLDEALFTESIEELRCDYQDASMARKKLLPNQERKLRTQFHQAQTVLAERYLDKIAKEVEELQTNMSLLKELHGSATSKKATFESTLEKNSTQIKTLESDMAQKSAKMQVPFAMTQETSSGFPPPPPPPPMMLSSVIKDTKVQAKPAPQSKSKAPTKEDMAHSLADEIKRGVTLKKSSTKTAKPIVQPKQSPSVQLKRTSPGTVADNKEPVIDLAGFIDGFVDEQALEKPKQTVKTEIKNEALERALRKIDAKEKERHREQMVFAQMKQFILNWGPESSAQIQEVENCLAAQKAIIQDLNDKLHHLDEAISLREQIEAARDAKIKKEEQSHKEDNEPTATPDTISVMVPLPPPPPPPPSVIPPPPPPPMGLKNVKDRLAPKTKTEDEIKTPTESEKAATKTKQPPNDERAKKLANIFSDPKFLQRAKQRQQAEKEAEDKKELFTQDKSKDKHPQAKSVHQDQADRLTKIQALLAKTDDSDVAAISFPIVLQPFVNSMSITKTKLQRVTVPDLCLLKKEHERVIQSQHGH